MSFALGQRSAAACFRGARTAGPTTRMTTTTTRRNKPLSCSGMLPRRDPARTRRFFSSGPEYQEPPRGNLWLKAGYGLLGLVAIDQALQFYQDHQRQEHRQALADLQQEADQFVQHQRKSWNSEYKNSPSLRDMKVAIMDPSLDGGKMLIPRKKGEVVHVVEEHVGPNKAYHLCRSSRDGSVGWYPVQFLEPVGK